MNSRNRAYVSILIFILFMFTAAPSMANAAVHGKRTNSRSDYSSNEVYANFRPVLLGSIAEGVLYRSSSPVDNQLNRAAYSDRLTAKTGIAVIINMAETGAKVKEMIAEPGFNSPYYKRLFQQKKVIGLGMDHKFASDRFKRKLKTGIEFMLANKGPYLIHCTLGRDRTGFAAALFGALMGAGLDEINDDFMLSFKNLNHVEKDTDIYYKNIGTPAWMFRYISGLSALDDVSLQRLAEQYLLSTGLTVRQINRLKLILSGKSVPSA